MKKLQKSSWSEIAKELREQLQECTLSNSALAAASGVNYFAIRRFRKGGIHNYTRSADALCTYFNIGVFEDNKVQNTALDKLIGELVGVWDGSESHAQLITKLIRSTKSFKVEERSK